MLWCALIRVKVTHLFEKAMETLRSELKKILVGSADLVNRAGSLQSPSWKFPEKLAVSVDVEGALKAGDSHSLVLELVVDRLLLVLQCCVQELEEASGRKTVVPLTLGSTVRRLSKCMLKNTSRSLEMKEQLSIKSEQITALASSLSELQHEHKALQSRLSSTKSSMAASMAVSSDFVASQSEQPDVEIKQPNMESGQLDMEGVFEFIPSTSVVPLPEVATISTQTTDTAFALCAQCSDTQLALVNSAHLITGLCKRHTLKPRFSAYNWKSLAMTGGIDIASWCAALRTDVAALDDSTRSLLQKTEALTIEKNELEKRVIRLKSKNQTLDVQLTSLKDMETRYGVEAHRSNKEIIANRARLDSVQIDMKRRNTEVQTELDASQKHVIDLSAAMAELIASQNQLETELQTVKSHEQELIIAKQNLEDQFESVMWQSQEVLNDRETELKKSRLYNQTLEKKYEVMKSKQSAILSRLDELDKDCGTLKVELVKVENSRTKLLQDLHEVQAKYVQVQTQLSSEQSKLSESNREQVKLNAQLTTLHIQLANAKDKLASEKENCRLLMDYPFVGQTSATYSDHVTSLTQNQESRKQITANTIRILLLEEQNNELRHTTNKKAKELKDISEPSCPKVDRSFPLWEPDLVSSIQDQQMFVRNSAKRRSLQQKQQQQQQQQQLLSRQPRASGSAVQLQNVIDLKLLEQGSIRMCRLNSNGRPRSSSKPRTSISGGSGAQRRLQSAGDSGSQSKRKGRLGHLITAVSEAHGAASRGDSKPYDGQKSKDNSSYEPVDIEVFLCDKCDRMFCHAEEMQKHCFSCEQLAIHK